MTHSKRLAAVELSCKIVTIWASAVLNYKNPKDLSQAATSQTLAFLLHKLWGQYFIHSRQIGLPKQEMAVRILYAVGSVISSWEKKKKSGLTSVFVKWVGECYILIKTYRLCRFLPPESSVKPHAVSSVGTSLDCCLITGWLFTSQHNMTPVLADLSVAIQEVVKM